MSRLGKIPVAVPAGVKAAVAEGQIRVEGPKGKLAWKLPPGIQAKVENEPSRIVLTRSADERQDRAYHGTARARIANMVRGVTDGFLRKLDIVGIGYNAKIQGKDLVMVLGLTHPVVLPIPEDLKVSCPTATTVQVEGTDKEHVGQFAARVRFQRPPEPYKQTGIRYTGEQVRKKAGKTFVSGG